MYGKDEFLKYATKHMGLSGMHVEKYMNAASVPNINGFTPQVIEERQMNIVGMDVFYQTIHHFFILKFGLEGSEHFIPYNQNTGMVAIEINGITAMMHPVVRWGVHNGFKPFW